MSESLLDDSQSDSINSAGIVLVLLELVDSLSDARNTDAPRTSLSDSVNDRGIVLLLLGLVVSLSDARNTEAPKTAR